MFDLLVYATVIIVVLWLRSDSLSHSDGIEVVLPIVILPPVADPWLDDTITVPATASTVTAPIPQLLLAPAIDVVEIDFIESLIAIADPALYPKFDRLNIVQLRSLGSLHQIKGASRWKKDQAIKVLSAA